VKIRGVRIEPAEITAILAQHPKVKACFVTACKDPHGDNTLAAYVVGSADGATIGDLRSFLVERLPTVMVPSVFVFLDALPITRNGKVDRRALPPADFLKADSHTDFVAPRTPAEQTLANIWCRLLNLEQVGVHDDFFVLGGHSLIATQLVSQIRQELNVDIQLRTIFSKPTIESLALDLLQQKASASSPHEVDGLLAEIESLSDASAEIQSRSATSQFHCPETKSPLFGRRHCNLIMLINERFDMASFERVAELRTGFRLDNQCRRHPGFRFESRSPRFAYFDILSSGDSAYAIAGRPHICGISSQQERRIQGAGPGRHSRAELGVGDRKSHAGFVGVR
jgi:acyl carrier protein